MNLAGGVGGIRSRASRNERVDVGDADVVCVAESAGADPLCNVQAKTGGFCCQLYLDERRPPGFDQVKRSYESRFHGGLLWQKPPRQREKATSRRFFLRQDEAGTLLAVPGPFERKALLNELLRHLACLVGCGF